MEPQRFVHKEDARFVAEIDADWVTRLPAFEGLIDEIVREPGKVLRSGQGQGVSTFRTVASTEMFAKVYRPSRLNRRIKDALRRYRAIEEWRCLCRAQAAGIQTAPMVLALTEKLRWNSRHLILTLPAPPRNLRTMLRGMTDDPAARRDLLTLLGSEIARLHSLGFCHAHLTTAHLFLDEQDRLVVIDLEKSLVRRPLPRSLIENNLRQIDECFPELKAPPEDIACFRKAYDSFGG